MSTEPIEAASPAPRETSSFLSRIDYSYVNPLLKLGWERPLEMSDMPALAADDQAATQFRKLKSAWEGRKGMGEAKWRFWMTLYDAFTSEFYWGAIWSLSESGLQIAQPIFLYYILKWFKNTDENYENGIIFSLALVLGSFLQVIIHHQLFYQTMRAGWCARMGCISLIHEKVLSSSYSSRLTHSNGKVINMTSTDVLRFDQSFIFLHYLWVAVLDVIVIFFLAANNVGHGAAAAGVGVLVIISVVQYANTSLLATFRKGTAVATDSRVSLTTQILCGMLSVKAACWEAPFSRKIAELRAVEASWILKSQFIKAFNLGMYFVGPVMASFTLFAVYSRSGNELDVDIIYPTISLFMVLRQSLGKKLSKALEIIPEVHVGTQRIMEFLECEEDNGAADFPAPADPDTVLEFTNVTSKWQTGNENVLNDVSLTVKKGELVMIEGPVGCGKSTILGTILKEAVLLDGKVKVQGPIAYVPQQPWIMAGTVRDNILFGSPYDEKRYKQTIAAASLVTDLEQLQNGDMTEIGERGVNLSGGQKARVSLARGLYSEAKIILLDDPLSAVDPHVCDALIRSFRALLKTKEFGILLVTHQTKAASFSNMTITLGQNGSISTAAPNNNVVEVDEIKPAEEPIVKKEKPLKLVEAEDRTKGQVTGGTYTAYAKNGGVVLCVVVVIMLIVGQTAQIMADYWLSVWADQNHDEQQEDFYLYMYAVFCGTTLLFGLLRVFLFFYFTTCASTQIHDKSFDSVVRTDMAFFTANPLGRIINRFSSDLGQIDEMLPVSLFDCLQMMCITLGSIILICIAVVWITIAIPFLVVLFGYLRKYATTSLREIKRLDGISRSPVFTSFAANLNGITSIKAFHKREEMQAMFQDSLEGMAKPYYWWFICNRWLGYRLDMMCFFLVFLLAGMGVALRDTVSASMYGLAMTYALSLSGMFQYMVRQSSLVETFMTSVERLLFYALSLPCEPGSDMPVTNPEWPATGSVQLNDISVKYRDDLPTVLHNVQASIPPGTKLGVVGRTGSGKSSLFQALLGLNKIESGFLEYDGVDCKMMPLKQMRKSVNLIPQEPILFSASVRYNLDPFGEAADDEIWRVLEAVTLTSEIKSLDQNVEENGANLSTGHRQLFSLARSMLRASKIVLIDEATANVDPETDMLIQKIIRTADVFKNATIITIAHRINTLIDSDIIMVLDNGRLVEMDTPQVLQGIPDGIFANMVEASKKI
eukprot:TRINITY_DN236_c1_g1_i1.p1 TRINITY_DN236_c1_g1~~TRINITY_DN236_c1_g1_i1.p1  ORF type:complete len:1245 (+),score=264.27 TRINITY_DN236_c1_g1_i1:81-3737(+)